jgi:hypothetical protein
MALRMSLVAAFLLAGAPTAAEAADFSCDGLVPFGKTMICSGFEPNWAVELVCAGPAMTSTFIDAFSGGGITTMPGTVAFASSNPLSFTTSHGITGSIAATPAAAPTRATTPATSPSRRRPCRASRGRSSPSAAGSNRRRPAAPRRRRRRTRLNRGPKLPR